MAGGVAFPYFILTYGTKTLEGSDLALLAVFSIVAAAMAYACARGAGMIVVGVYGLSQHARDIDPDWRGMKHALRQGETWVQAGELVLILATIGGMIWALVETVRHFSLFGGAMFGLLVALTWWPMIRYRIRFRRWPN